MGKTILNSEHNLRNRISFQQSLRALPSFTTNTQMVVFYIVNRPVGVDEGGYRNLINSSSSSNNKNNNMHGIV